MPADEDQVTTAEQWGKKKKGFVIELPSGEKARIRRSLDLTSMLKEGRIPNPLNSIIVEMIQKQQTEIDFSKLDENALQQFLQLVDDVVCQCFIEPKCEQPPKKTVIFRKSDWSDDEWRQAIIDNNEKYEKMLLGWQPSAGAVSIEDVEQDDRMFVFAVAQGAATDLASFRSEQARYVAGMGSGEAVEATA